MTLQPLTEAPKFIRWISQLRQNGLTIHQVDIKHVRYRHNGEALFGVVEVDATTPEGAKIPPICFVKGQVVCILIALIEKETGQTYLVLVRQRRICNGALTYEHVAGMVDMNDDPKDVAIREAMEEAALTLDPDRVFALNEEPLFPSTGTSDEAMFFFYTELHLSSAEIAAIHNRQTGVDYEQEHISTFIAPLEEARRLITNTNGLLHIYLYLEARAAGK